MRHGPRVPAFFSQTRRARGSRVVLSGHDLDCGGRRRVRDGARFVECVGQATVVWREPPIYCLWSSEGALLQEWGGARAPVYFDFGDLGPADKLPFDQPTLWRLSPGGPNGRRHVVPVGKSLLVNAHLTGQPLEQTLSATVDRAEANRMMPRVPLAGPLARFERYMAGRLSRRRRF